MLSFPDIATATVSEWSGIWAKKGMRVMLRQPDSGAALLSGEGRAGSWARPSARALHNAGPAQPVLGTALAAAAGTSGGRAALISHGVEIFLLVLVVLLALSLVAIVRLQPPERRSSAEGVGDERGSLPRPVAPVALPRRAGQPSHRSYVARHVPGPLTEQGRHERPKVSGGPPWGPVPRPPGV